MIAKPSELTPRTAFLLGEICNAAGLPPGVLNIVHGTGATAGQAMLEHPGIKAISFTGGSATGRHVASVVAPQLKKCSLELGGKNPNLVFADGANPKALQTSVFAAFGNQGRSASVDHGCWWSNPSTNSSKVISSQKLRS